MKIAGCYSDCGAGFYNKVSDLTCQPCDSTCYDCSGALSTNCTKCSGTLYLNASACGSTCPSNTYKKT